MIYENDYFYDYFTTEKEFTITKHDIALLRTLKSFIDQSGYYNTMVQWSHVDNQHISPDELNRLWVCIQFITMTGKITQEFIDKHNVKEYHIHLLRQLWCDFFSEDGNYKISMGYKRPFGNSYVFGDVKEAMLRCGFTPNCLDEDDEPSITEEIVDNCLIEFSNILIAYIREFELDYHSFEFKVDLKDSNQSRKTMESNIKKWRAIDGTIQHYQVQNWCISKSEERANKIDAIIINT